MDESASTVVTQRSIQMPKPFWENFQGNRTISLQTHGEVLIQDVFNEKKILKLEVHTNEMSNPFGNTTRGHSQSQKAIGQTGNDLRQIIGSGLSPPEAGFETIS